MCFSFSSLDDDDSQVRVLKLFATLFAFQTVIKSSIIDCRLQLKQTKLYKGQTKRFYGDENLVIGTIFTTSSSKSSRPRFSMVSHSLVFAAALLIVCLVTPSLAAVKCSGNDCLCIKKCQGPSEPVKCLIKNDAGLSSVIDARNKCFCTCSGGKVYIQPPCICPRDFNPTTCRNLSTGKISTKNNPCLCRCSGGEPICPCPKILDPVQCRNKSTGEVTTANNECLCKCSGGEAIKSQDCGCPNTVRAISCYNESTGVEKTANSVCLCLCSGGIPLE